MPEKRQHQFGPAPTRYTHDDGRTCTQTVTGVFAVTPDPMPEDLLFEVCDRPHERLVGKDPGGTVFAAEGTAKPEPHASPPAGDVRESAAVVEPEMVGPGALRLPLVLGPDDRFTPEAVAGLVGQTPTFTIAGRALGPVRIAAAEQDETGVHVTFEGVPDEVTNLFGGSEAEYSIEPSITPQQRLNTIRMFRGEIADPERNIDLTPLAPLIEDLIAATVLALREGVPPQAVADALDRL